MSQFVNYYEILGVNLNSSEQEIKNSFRKLAKQYHPDINKEKNAHAKFILINEAHLILSDSEARRKYDETFKLQTSNHKEPEIDDSINDFIFEDEELEQWHKNAKKQSEEIAKLKYDAFLKLISDVNTETIFHLSNGLILFISVLCTLIGIGLISILLTKGNIIGIFGIFMLPFGYLLFQKAHSNWENH